MVFLTILLFCVHDQEMCCLFVATRSSVTNDGAMTFDVAEVDLPKYPNCHTAGKTGQFIATHAHTQASVVFLFVHCCGLLTPMLATLHAIYCVCAQCCAPLASVGGVWCLPQESTPSQPWSLAQLATRQGHHHTYQHVSGLNGHREARSAWRVPSFLACFAPLHHSHWLAALCRCLHMGDCVL